VDAVGSGRARPEEAELVQELCWRPPVLRQAIPDLLLRLGQVDVDARAKLACLIADALKELLAARIDRVGAEDDLYAPVPRAIITLEHADGIAEEALPHLRAWCVQQAGREHGPEASLQHGLGHLPLVEIHIAEAGGAREGHLKAGQERPPIDVLGLDACLHGPDVLPQPGVERHVLAQAPEERHGRVRVAVHQARQHGLLAAIYDLLGPEDVATRPVREDHAPLTHRQAGIRYRSPAVHGYQQAPSHEQICLYHARAHGLALAQPPSSGPMSLA